MLRCIRDEGGSYFYNEIYPPSTPCGGLDLTCICLGEDPNYSPYMYSLAGTVENHGKCQQYTYYSEIVAIQECAQAIRSLNMHMHEGQNQQSGFQIVSLQEDSQEPLSACFLKPELIEDDIDHYGVFSPGETDSNAMEVCKIERNVASCKERLFTFIYLFFFEIILREYAVTRL